VVARETVQVASEVEGAQMRVAALPSNQINPKMPEVMGLRISILGNRLCSQLENRNKAMIEAEKPVREAQETTQWTGS
jgi:hypothetical protein